jgi:hypothetical protein
MMLAEGLRENLCLPQVVARDDGADAQAGDSVETQPFRRLRLLCVPVNAESASRTRLDGT